jgi:hypothetical protein
LLKAGNDSLQFLQAAILLFDLTAQALHFMVELGAVLVRLGKITVVRIVSALDTSHRERRGTDTLDTLDALQLSCAVPRHVHDKRGVFVTVHVAAAKMLAQVLLACESIASTAVAIVVWAHQGLLGIGVFLVHLALVT